MEFLIVDDDHVMQEITGAMLRRLGFEFRLGGDGVTALDACATDPPQAVLMVLRMPGMDGLSAIREIRRRQRSREMPDFPIIVASAFYTPADRAACFEAGADGFVTKPLMRAKLGTEIFRVIKRLATADAPTLPGWEGLGTPPAHRRTPEQ
jgi:CheY-like chemotaxis protein